jgi:hypothetical protein
MFGGETPLKIFAKQSYFHFIINPHLALRIGMLRTDGVP